MTQRPDVVIIGLGAMGSAALYKLAKLGVRPTGIDRFHPPHSFGSSHGETRITRQAIGEGEHYVPFLLRTHEIWRELEGETGQRLMLANGGLILTRPEPQTGGRPGFVQATINAARKYGIAHEVLDAGEVSVRFPQLRLQGNEIAYYEPGAGTVFPEMCISAELDMSRKLGADIRLGQTVLGIEQVGQSVVVTTDKEKFTAGTAIVCAGPWVPELMGGEFKRHLTLHRQVLHWFPASRPADYDPQRFPVFIWKHGNAPHGTFYGFPRISGDEIKLAQETYVNPVDTLASINREVEPGESDLMFEAHVRGRLNDIVPKTTRSAVCLYTVTPDDHFLIDRHPTQDKIIVVSACSGHGFKHSAAIGEAVAELAITGGSGINLSPFSVSRLSEPNPTSVHRI